MPDTGEMPQNRRQIYQEAQNYIKSMRQILLRAFMAFMVAAGGSMRKIYGFFGLIAICACTTLPLNLEKPKLSLQTVNLSDSNLSDTNVVFHFLVENPNTVAVAVDQLDYALKINGKSLTQGVLKEGLKVGAKSSSLIDLPVRVKYADLASSVSDFLSQGTSKYEINGAAKLGLFSIPFSEKGDLKISDLKQ